MAAQGWGVFSMRPHRDGEWARNGPSGWGMGLEWSRRGGIQNGHINQVKKMNPKAPRSVAAGSPVFTPHQTLPSMNCCTPAKTGISATGK